MTLLRESTALLLALVLVCPGCGQPVEPLDATQINTVFGDPANHDIIRAPDRVEAYRVGGWRTSDKTTGEYANLAGPIAVPAATTAQLSAIFTDRRTYAFDVAKGCTFDPGVRLRFFQGDHSVDVLLCFVCRELQVVRDGKRQGGEDFDHAEPALVAIAKQLFPNDKAIAVLKP